MGCHLLLQMDLPKAGIKGGSPALQADSLPAEQQERISPIALVDILCFPSTMNAPVSKLICNCTDAGNQQRRKDE